MRPPFKCLASLLLASFPSLGLFGQTLQNVRATFQEGKVHITYDLSGGNQAQKYAFDLYSSHNNYVSPLRWVTGDIGKNISPGFGKSIDWDAANELGQFKGELTFKVRGEAMPLALQFKNPANGGSVRRGKTTSVQWEGGRIGANVKLELYEGSTLLQTITETKNTGIYSWQLPKDMKKGTYNLKLTEGGEAAQSGAFAVKSKTPVLLFVLPVAAVGGALAAMGGGGGGDNTTTTTTTASDLPAAPGPK